MWILILSLFFCVIIFIAVSHYFGFKLSVFTLLLFSNHFTDLWSEVVFLETLIVSFLYQEICYIITMRFVFCGPLLWSSPCAFVRI